MSPRIPEEQLSFFDDSGPSAFLPGPASHRDGRGQRQQLAALLQGDLNFRGENGNYASHQLHAFAAKFPPQLPRVFIRGLSSPGDIILDPMMGSGTTVVEAMLAGRRGVGLDIDPLALRLCQSKTVPLQVAGLRNVAQEVVAQALSLATKEAVGRHLAQRFDTRTRAFVDYWFLPRTQHELMALVLAIESMTDPSVRRFFELVFSATIITKSGGVTRARDLAHSRPHLDRDKVPKNAIEQFSLRLQKNLTSMAELPHGPGSNPLHANATAMPFADGVIDLIVTSPPYANAIDYMRAHKFSLVWLGRSVGELSELRSTYIGSERLKGAELASLPEKPERIITQLAQLDGSKSRILRKYFTEMTAVFTEMNRVLRRQAAAILVVGSSMMRGIDVETHTCLTAIAAQAGFDVVGVVPRRLDRDRRMMPARFGRQSGSMIEQRMHEEYVIGLLKP